MHLLRGIPRIFKYSALYLASYMLFNKYTLGFRKVINVLTHHLAIIRTAGNEVSIDINTDLVHSNCMCT